MVAFLKIYTPKMVFLKLSQHQMTSKFYSRILVLQNITFTKIQTLSLFYELKNRSYLIYTFIDNLI